MIADLSAFLDRLHELDVRLDSRGGKLVFNAPANAATPELEAELRRHKPSLLAMLNELDALIGRLVRHDPSNWPQDEIELARVVGRGDLNRALRCLKLLNGEHEGNRS